jgi:2-oxoglutarate dehydrogenase E1 component
VTAELRRYRKAKEFVWLQEEPQNMGGWTFIEPRLSALLDGDRISYIGRDASASPATGSYKIHQREQAELVEFALHGAAPHIARSVKSERSKTSLPSVTRDSEPAPRLEKDAYAR